MWVSSFQDSDSYAGLDAPLGARCSSERISPHDSRLWCSGRQDRAISYPFEEKRSHTISSDVTVTSGALMLLFIAESLGAVSQLVVVGFVTTERMLRGQVDAKHFILDLDKTQWQGFINVSCHYMIRMSRAPCLPCCLTSHFSSKCSIVGVEPFQVLNVSHLSSFISNEVWRVFVLFLIGGFPSLTSAICLHG